MKHTVVALSSAEAEYVSQSTSAKDLMWIRNLINELCQFLTATQAFDIETTVLYVDITAAMSIATKSQLRSKSKHVEVKYHHVRDLLKSGYIALEYIPSKEILADLLTKPVKQETLMNLRQIILQYTN